MTTRIDTASVELDGSRIGASVTVVVIGLALVGA